MSEQDGKEGTKLMELDSIFYDLDLLQTELQNDYEIPVACNKCFGRGKTVPLLKDLTLPFKALSKPRRTAEECHQKHPVGRLREGRPFRVGKGRAQSFRDYRKVSEIRKAKADSGDDSDSSRGSGFNSRPNWTERVGRWPRSTFEDVEDSSDISSLSSSRSSSPPRQHITNSEITKNSSVFNGFSKFSHDSSQRVPTMDDFPSLGKPLVSKEIIKDSNRDAWPVKKNIKDVADCLLGAPALNVQTQNGCDEIKHAENINNNGGPTDIPTADVSSMSEKNVIKVLNLPLNCTEEELKGFIESFGPVLECSVVQKQVSSEGFIRMENSEHGEWVISCLNDFEGFPGSDGTLSCFMSEET